MIKAMDLFDFKKLVESYSIPNQVRCFCDIFPRDREAAVTIQILDKNQYIEVHDRREIEWKEIDSMSAPEAMQFMRLAIKELEKLRR